MMKILSKHGYDKSFHNIYRMVGNDDTLLNIGLIIDSNVHSFDKNLYNTHISVFILITGGIDLGSTVVNNILQW